MVSDVVSCGASDCTVFLIVGKSDSVREQWFVRQDVR